MNALTPFGWCLLLAATAAYPFVVTQLSGWVLWGWLLWVAALFLLVLCWSARRALREEREGP
jgi:hypothetical protein